MIALVGYTGFVGSNIYLKARNRIEGVFNSQNVSRAYGLDPEMLIYAGLRAERYLAAQDPYQDMEQVLQAEENIRRINPQKLVLISTVDVYQEPVGWDEEDAPLSHRKGGTGNMFHPYGLHRYYLESWVRKNYPDSLIIRLPALYGYNIRKNFIYDLMYMIPFMLRKEKFEELRALEKEDDEVLLGDCYKALDNGFYRCEKLGKEKRELLKKKFRELGFTALDFTDSRSTFQFYPLMRLWEDIQTALSADLTLLNLVTEPVTAAELYKSVTGESFQNELDPAPVPYDLKTVHAELFGGRSGYICSKEAIIGDIKHFLQDRMRE